MTKEESWLDITDKESPKYEAELSRAVFKEVDTIENEQPFVLRNMEDAYIKYLGYKPAAMVWSGTTGCFDRPKPRETRSLVRSGADTATALISQHMPKPTPQTNSADIQLQRVASQLDLFLMGAFYAGEVYYEFPLAFKDNTICGTGTLAFIPRGEGKDFRVDVKRIHPCEVVIPERQCLSSPKDYTERYRVTRESTRSLQKKYSKECICSNDYSLTLRGSTAKDTVWVIEAIHISPAGRRRVVVAPGVVLEDEEWPYPFFPYVDLWWTYPSSGFYGDGIAFRQGAKQSRIDYLYTYIHKALNNHLTIKVFNGPNASPTVHKLGGFAEAVAGRADPKFVEMPPPSEAVYRNIDDLYRAGMEEEGISTHTAANQLPSGLTTAPAQQEYSFKEGQRFSPQAQRYEYAIAIATAERLIGMYQHAAMAYGEGARVTLTGRDFITVVDWPDVDIEAQEFKLVIGASSIETQSPAGRQQKAQTLLQAQLIGPVEARIMMANADLAHMDALALATRNYCQVFSHRLLLGEVPAIDPDVDLVELVKTLHESYHRVAAIDLRKSDPESRRVLANIRDRIEEADRLMKERLAQVQQEMINESAGSPTNPTSDSGIPNPGPLPA